MNIKKLHAKIKYSEIFQEYGTDFSKLIKSTRLPYDFIDMYFKRLKPFQIEKYQSLNDALIDKYALKLNWVLLLKHQDISEYLLEKYYNLINKTLLSKTQKMSYAFMKRHANDLNFDYIKFNLKCSATDVCKIMKELNK